MRRLVTTAVAGVVVAAAALLPTGPAEAVAPVLGPELVLPPRLSDWSGRLAVLGAGDAGVALTPAAVGSTTELWAAAGTAALAPTGVQVGLGVFSHGLRGSTVWWSENPASGTGRVLRSYDLVSRATTRLTTSETVVAVVRHGWVGFVAGTGRLVLHRGGGDVELATGLSSALTGGLGDDAGVVVRLTRGRSEDLAYLDATTDVLRTVATGTDLATVALGPTTIVWKNRPAAQLTVLPRSGGPGRTVAAPADTVVTGTDGTAAVISDQRLGVQLVDLSGAVAPRAVVVPAGTTDVGGAYAARGGLHLALGGDAVTAGVWSVARATATLDRELVGPRPRVVHQDADLADGVLHVAGLQQLPTGRRGLADAYGIVTGARPSLTARRVEPLLSSTANSAGRSLDIVGLPQVRDRGMPTGRTLLASAGRSTAISGPVAVAGGSAWWADASPLRPGVVPSSAAAWDLADGVVTVVASGGAVIEEDLLAPRGAGNPRAVGALTGCTATCATTFRTGARQAVYWSGEPTTGQWRAHDLVTGTDRALGIGPGPRGRVRVGDGFVAWTDPATSSVVVTDLDGPAAPPVTAGTGTLLDADGSAVVWLAPDGALHVRDVVPSAPPKSLGVLAAPGFSPNGDGLRDTWAPQLDATKPLTGVVLTLTDAAGTVVRRVAGTAPDASLRDAVWDGTTDAGTPAPQSRYRWTITARGADGSGALPPVTGTVALARTATGYRPVTAARVLDTRGGLGAPKAPVGPGQTLLVPVAGRAGVPADASAVALTLTGVAPTASTVLVAGAPDGAATGSTLNLVAGDTRSTFVLAPVDAAGRVAIRNALGSVNLVADVAGYLPAGADATVVAPTRVLDTRSEFGAALDRTVAGATVGRATTDVTGRGPVPEGAAAALVTLTAVAPAGTTQVLAAGGGDVTDGDVLRVLAPRRTTASATLVRTDGEGRLFLDEHGVAADVLADVAAWFPAGSGLRTTAAPTVLADTRATGRPVPTAGSLTVPVAGRAGVPRTGVAAVVLSVAVPDPAAGGYVTLRPSGWPRTGTSNLGFGAHAGAAGTVVVPLGADGAVTLDNASSALDVQVSVLGWFAG